MSELIDKQDAIDAIMSEPPDAHYPSWYADILRKLPSAESVKAYTKADYIMALHKEYGCTLTMAEEAHNKALEHLRNKARMKGCRRMSLYDVFTDKYIDELDIDPTAPPERYKKITEELLIQNAARWFAEVFTNKSDGGEEK